MFGRLFFGVAVYLVATTQGLAHGDTREIGGECRMRIDPFDMHFTGYQPEKSDAKFCDDIPNTGQTNIVLDAIGSDMNNMDVDMRVLRNVGQSSDGENEAANTETYAPPQKLTHGTFYFSYDFKNKGDYIGIVTARAEDGKVYRARFPFSVGQTFERQMMATVVAVVVALIGGWLYFRNVGPKKPA